MAQIQYSWRVLRVQCITSARRRRCDEFGIAKSIVFGSRMEASECSALPVLQGQRVVKNNISCSSAIKAAPRWPQRILWNVYFIGGVPQLRHPQQWQSVGCRCDLR